MSVESKILLQVEAENSVVNLKLGFRSLMLLYFTAAGRGHRR
jgi:hypothetical protein